MLASVYFVALTSANLLLISVFWSAMSDVWRPELAKRFYGYVAAGGSAGAIARARHRSRAWCADVGPAAAHRRRLRVHRGAAPRWSPLARATLRRCAGRRARCRTARFRSAAARSTTSRDWRRSPYLLGIAGIIIVGQTIGAFMYNEQGKYVADAVLDGRRTRGHVRATWKSP